jgi:hypothetical protein
VTQHEQKIQKQLAIPVHLLEADPQQRPWSNLGDWSVARVYRNACCDLACRIGRAANLTPSDSILELACGHGASLNVWSEVFGVQAVDALERQNTAIQSIEADRPSALRRLWHMDVNTIFSGKRPWPMDEHYDALVVVDAAYHFHSLATFLEHSSLRLRAGGRIAFTTFLCGPAWSTAGLWQKALVLQLAQKALIPAPSLLDEQTAAKAFGAAGFTAPVCVRLNQEVLGGFVQFVERRRRELPWSDRMSRGWWKVEVTAAAARQLLRTELLHYVLLNAVKV